MDFLAASVALRIASGTSLALPWPWPTRPLPSPTTTRAAKPNRRPPFTTLATRLMKTSFSISSGPSSSRLFRRSRPPRPPPPLLSSRAIRLRPFQCWDSLGAFCRDLRCPPQGGSDRPGQHRCRRARWRWKPPPGQIKSSGHLRARLRPQPSPGRGTCRRRGRTRPSLRLPPSRARRPAFQPPRPQPYRWSWIACP